MTWRPHPLSPVREATAVAVRAAFPRAISTSTCTPSSGPCCDHLFADLYADRGHPVGVAPWRLALATIMQYIEGLTDRQTLMPCAAVWIGSTPSASS